MYSLRASRYEENARCSSAAAADVAVACVRASSTACFKESGSAMSDTAELVRKSADKEIENTVRKTSFISAPVVDFCRRARKVIVNAWIRSRGGLHSPCSGPAEDRKSVV